LFIFSQISFSQFLGTVV